MKRRRRRRLIPLVLGVSLIALITGLVTASSDASSSAAEAPSLNESVVDGKESDAIASIDLVGRARSLRANEMGQVLVLMYHLIGYEDSKYNRTPDEFRQDIADLKTAGYYPVNVTDLAIGDMNVPAGKSPVVITFDDSSGGQYRIDENGNLDPNCAVAIMEEAVASGDWASRATFYPLLDVDAPDHVLFGQPELAETKLKQLVAWGYEVGSHTVSHLNLKKASVEEAKKQLFESKSILEAMIGDGYEVTSLAAPFGEYPAQASILKMGEHNDQPYKYEAALKAAGGPYFSPFSDGFREYHITRIGIGETSLEQVLGDFETSPELRYVSDGDAATISVPYDLDPSLGAVRTDLRAEVVRY